MIGVVEPFRDGREHLVAELAWLDAALLALVRAMPRAADGGQGWFVSAAETESLLVPGGRAAVPPDGPATELLTLRAALRERRAASAAAGVALPLDRVCSAFGLGPVAEILVVACLAAEVDAAYGKVFCYLHDDVSRTRFSRDLAHRLAMVAGATGASVPVDRSAPVFRWGVVSAGEGAGPAQELILDPDVTDFLLERPVRGVARDTAAGSDVGSVAAALYPEPIEELTRLLKQQRATVVRFDGPGSSDGAAVFVAVCRVLGVGYERVRLDPVTPPEVTREQLRGAYRRAALTGSGVFLDGLDDLQADPRAQAALLGLDETITAGSWCTGVTGGAGWPVPGEVTVLPVRLELPAHPERTRAWRQAVPGLPDRDAATLAARSASGTADMAATVALARLLGGGADPDRAGIEAARRISGRSGATSGTIMVVPRANWDDLVLPADIAAHLREFCAQIRHRARVGHEWGLWRRASLGRGLAALFLGPSGTGKTLAAEVVAGDAGMDLMKIDLSGVVSKYIGETEKNLARVFDDAARRGAVLFFDEADALFGKRSEVRDAHDRYANVEVGFLLQKVEEFDGVVILATNLPRNIDDAFLRRMRMSVEFPFPDEAARLRLWQAHLPPELPRDDDVDLAALARECKVAGGVISKIVWNAACLAADEGDRLRMAHLRHAVRREYQWLGKPVPVAR
ncbi:ATP-binding protein [Solwaraspora sp. WMMB762]|uniref:ATP-binding protein n=1 Tax=Solwaraspora sp. WMMB762 TaxID=3404120 RepID=UPI003B92869C